jgi:hypothetical protein
MFNGRRPVEGLDFPAPVVIEHVYVPSAKQKTAWRKAYDCTVPANLLVKVYPTGARAYPRRWF